MEVTIIPAKTKQLKVSQSTYRELTNYKSPSQTFDQAINDLLSRSRENQDLTTQLEPIKQQLNLIMNQIQILQLSQLQKTNLESNNMRNQVSNFQESILNRKEEMAPTPSSPEKD